VLGLSNRIHELIEKKRSYAALRALDGNISSFAVLQGRATENPFE
jgi:hypothetical protein